MKRPANIIFSTILIFTLISCTPSEDPLLAIYDYEWFSKTPVNIVELNTAFDDYNSNIETIGNSIYLYYSSNKNSEGENFDIVTAYLSISLNYKSQGIEFEIIKDASFWNSHSQAKVNSKYNELGPFSFHYLLNEKDSHAKEVFMFANDKAVNFDIQFIYVDIGECAMGPTCTYQGPINARALNSDSDDLYPTINFDLNYPTKGSKSPQFYFCSDRSGDFDIYQLNVNGRDIKNWLETGVEEAVICDVLSSGNDDKCPLIKGNLMVFASDRENGFGGFDLWYSVYTNGTWSEPVNFGPEINTEFDEYRPVVDYFKHSKNDFMIFSSNRPGGSGGFDLYYAGIPKMILAE